MTSNLKYSERVFSKEELSERAKRFGFTQPQFLELLAWDYELVAQLQAANEKLVLKGGAAVQLFLPPEKQRSSVDVDFIVPSSSEMRAGLRKGLHDGGLRNGLQNGLARGFQNADKIMEQIRSRLGGLPGFKEESLAPKQPKVSLPMETRLVTLPSSVGQAGNKTCQIKVDFLFADFEVPTTIIKEAETVALAVKNVKVASFGSLVGDKLCTLARGTIGVETTEDLPKHVYDVEMLAFGTGRLDAAAFSEAHNAMRKIIGFESKIRGKNYSFEDAAASMEKTMTNYSRMDLNPVTSETGPARDAVEHFQEIHLSKTQRKPFYEWAAKALRIKHLVRLMKFIHEKNSPTTAQNAFQAAVQGERKLNALKGGALDEAKEKLFNYLKHAHSGQPGLKELYEKPVARLYWELLENAHSPSQISKLQEYSG